MRKIEPRRAAGRGSPPVRLLVGLGNPGRKHERNRHNTGFWFLDRLTRSLSLRFRIEARLHAELCETRVHEEVCRFAKPDTWMNDSGIAVRAITDFYKLPPEQVLVAHDDLDLPPGVLRVKDGGGHGGHNGLRSVIQHLGDSGFKRLRIGIGHPGQRDRVLGWVLGDPTAAERKGIDAAIESGLGHAEDLLRGKFAEVMNVLNRSA